MFSFPKNTLYKKYRNPEKQKTQVHQYEKSKTKDTLLKTIKEEMDSNIDETKNPKKEYTTTITKPEKCCKYL